MNQKQNSLYIFAKEKGIEITNIEDYLNKDSILTCVCMNKHTTTNSVANLLKTDFECISCLSLDEGNISDSIPYFLSLDAATYVTGYALFNKQGQLLRHGTIEIEKRKDYFDRLAEIKQSIIDIIKDNGISCVILEDIQYQQNPELFKKLGMMHGLIRFTIIKELGIELITAMADEWRSFNNIGGTKRPEQKKAAIEKARLVYHDDISEDESEAIFLGKYGIDLFKRNKTEEE